MVRVVEDEGHDTVDGRPVRYEITGGFHAWEWKHKAKVWDDATGIMGKAGGVLARDTALRKAKDDLRAKLKEAGTTSFLVKQLTVTYMYMYYLVGHLNTPEKQQPVPTTQSRESQPTQLPVNTPFLPLTSSSDHHTSSVITSSTTPHPSPGDCNGTF